MGLRKLVIFNLPENVSEKEVGDVFGKHGRLSECSLRRQGDSTMAFIEYAESRDADDAIKDRHGYSFQGNRIRVEFSRPGGSKGKGKHEKGRFSSRSRGRYDSRRRGKGGRSPPRRDSRRRGGGGKPGLKDSYFKVRVSGMPASASWQDLKDFLRSAGTVKFTEIVEPGVGIGGFMTSSEARDAILDLDGKKMTARNGDTNHVMLEEERKGGGGGGRRGRSRSASRGRQRSRGNGRGRSHSRSY